MKTKLYSTNYPVDIKYLLNKIKNMNNENRHYPSLYAMNLWENIGLKYHNPQSTIVKNALNTHCLACEFLVYQFKENKSFDKDYFLECLNHINSTLFIIIEREI